MARYDQFFVKLMVTEELGLPEADSNMKLIYDAMAMTISFIIMGTLPLIVYIIDMKYPIYDKESNSNPENNQNQEYLFIISSTVCCMSLFLLGSLKCRYSMLTWYYSGFETVLTGSISGITAYTIATLVKLYTD